jgi:hypothetical protein
MQNKIFNRLIAIALLTGICSAITPVFFGQQAIAKNSNSNSGSDNSEDDKKVDICHFPPGNTANVQMISISKNSLKTHEDHHDDYLAKDGNCNFSGTRTLLDGSKYTPPTTTPTTTAPTTTAPTTTTTTSTTNNSKSDFSFFRGASNPTRFHNTTYSNNLNGAAAFQQFANTESTKLDLNTINARKLDPSKLKITDDTYDDVKIYFINEGAGYRNQMKVVTTGTTPIDGFVFKDISCIAGTIPACIGAWGGPANADEALAIGDYVNLGTLKAGTDLDFKLIPDGFNNSNATVLRMLKENNSDGLQHIIAYQYQNYLVIGWEDINGGGDLDYNDVIVAVDIGQSNLSAIPSADPLPPPVVSTPSATPGSPPVEEITGTTRISSDVEVKVDTDQNGTTDLTYEAEVNSNGTWTVDFAEDEPVGQTESVEFNNDSVDVTVTAIEDFSGTTDDERQSASKKTILLDTIVPILTFYSVEGTDDRNQTYDNTPTFTGEANVPGTTVEIKDGTTVLGTTTVKPDGTWEFTPTTPLTTGEHDITAEITTPGRETPPVKLPAPLKVEEAPVNPPAGDPPVGGDLENKLDKEVPLIIIQD